MLISDILIFMVWTMDAIMGMAGGTLQFDYFQGELRFDFFTERRYHWDLFDLKILDISVA